MHTRLTSEQRDGRQLIDWRLTALVSVGTAVELGLAVLALATRLWWPAALLLVSLAPSLTRERNPLSWARAAVASVCAAIGAFAVIRSLGAPADAAVAAAAALSVWPGLVLFAYRSFFRFR